MNEASAPAAPQRAPAAVPLSAILRALAALQRVDTLRMNTSPTELGNLQAECMGARFALAAYLEQLGLRVPVSGEQA
jgi:hypothetical protein